MGTACLSHTERDFCAFMAEEAARGAAEARAQLRLAGAAKK